MARATAGVRINAAPRLNALSQRGLLFMPRDARVITDYFFSGAGVALAAGAGMSASRAE
jgi:predicted phage tail protein